MNKYWNFPAGEAGVQLVDPPEDKSLPVQLVLKGGRSDDILRLMMEVDAYIQAGYFTLELYMPYVPYGRQDRVTTPGTSFSLEAFVNIIAPCHFKKITIVDPHSQVTCDLLRQITPELVVVSSTRVVEAASKYFEGFFLGPKEETVIVAPDLGAIPRAEAAASVLGIPKVVLAHKERDPATGHITGYRLNESVAGKHVIVVDDICDGGRTFIELQKEMGGSASQILFVTHGIFSQGYHTVANYFDAVYTTDSLPRRQDDGVPLYVILPLKELIAS